MWRTGGDINPMWGPIIGEVENLAGRGQLAGPGGWNYPVRSQSKLCIQVV